jgi:ZIP family zinc transporter
MIEAGFWGLVGASSLLVGAVIGLRIDAHPRLVGLVMGFGAGALISAVSFELTADAYESGGADAVTLGLGAGALAFFLGDREIERRGGGNRMSTEGTAGPDSSSALLLGAVLDGIPESAVIGLSLLEGGEVGVAVVVAVFLSNMPEALASANGLRSAGHSPRWIIGAWSTVVVCSTLAAAIGYGLLEDASGDVVGAIQAFAAGAVLTMLADAMMPEAFRNGGKAVGLITVLGFALASLLSQTA